MATEESALIVDSTKNREADKKKTNTRYNSVTNNVGITGDVRSEGNRAMSNTSLNNSYGRYAAHSMITKPVTAELDLN